MTIERKTITTREEWLEWRRADVTASQVGALFNCHTYVTPLRLYAEKRGTEFVNEDNLAMRRGRWLEPAVGKAVMEMRPEWTLEPAKEYLRDPDLRLGATPDFYIHGDPRGLGVLQAKTVAPSVYAREWGDGAEPPLWILLQVAQEGMLAEADFVVVAGLLIDANNMDISIHDLGARNPLVEAKLKEAVKAFWDDVERGIEPEPDYGRDVDVVKAMWTRERAKDFEIDLSGNNRIPELLAERAVLKADIKSMEERAEEIDTELKFALKDAAVGTGVDGWRVTYRTSHVKSYTVAERTQRVLRVSDLRGK